MGKQIVVYTSNGILFWHKKEWSTDACCNVDEPWQYCAKWKKPETEGPILCNSIYVKYQE